MRKPMWIIGVIVSGLGLGWVAAGALGAVSVFESQLSADFFNRLPQAKHRLVGNLLCEEPVTTFLSVLSLHGVKDNPVTMVWTDADGLQAQVEEVLGPDRPLRLSCEDVPVEFSQAAPVMVHVDSRYATRGMLMHVVRGSPIKDMDSVNLDSQEIVLGPSK